MDNKKFLKFILIAFASLFLVSGILVLVFYLREHNRVLSLCMEDYVTVNFSGYDTIGTADFTFDGERFADDFKAYAKKPSKKVMKEYGLSDYYIDDVAEKVSFRLSDTTGLTNGQRIYVYVNYSEETFLLYKIMLTDDVFDVTVSGLTELVTIDLFDPEPTVFSGMSPYVKAEFTPYNQNGLFINFYSDAKKNLKSGDEITVTAGVTPEQLATNGFRAAALEQTIAVPAGNHYITDPADVGDAFLHDLKIEAEKSIEAYDDNLLIGIYGYEYKGFVLNWPEEQSVLNPNRIYLIYEVKAGAIMEDWSGVEFYYPIEFTKPAYENHLPSYQLKVGIKGTTKYKLMPFVYAKGYTDYDTMMADLCTDEYAISSSLMN